MMQNLNEFRSGPDYDSQYGASYNPEINFLTAFAREQNAKILDVCCGTGIVTIPLAEAGFDSKRNILYFDMKRKYSDGKEIHSAIEIKFIPYNDMLSLIESRLRVRRPICRLVDEPI